jgi:hypothetical protein
VGKLAPPRGADEHGRGRPGERELQLSVGVSGNRLVGKALAWNTWAYAVSTPAL